MSDWKTLSSTKVYETPWISVRRDEVLNQNGKPLTYSVVDLQHPSVFILPTNDKREIFIQRGYHYTVDMTLWEFPAGHSDGEEPLTAAKRELREETGLASNDWTHLGRLYQTVGIANAPFDVFWAKNVYSVTDERDEQEQLSEQQFMTIEAIDELIRNGEFGDSPMLALLYLVKIHGL